MKIGIIGMSIAVDTTLIEAMERLETKIEIVAVDDSKIIPKDVFISQPFIITRIEDPPIITIPKVKGHIRPYKYHP